jgi:hypothetical protein
MVVISLYMMSVYQTVIILPEGREIDDNAAATRIEHYAPEIPNHGHMRLLGADSPGAECETCGRWYAHDGLETYSRGETVVEGVQVVSWFGKSGLLLDGPILRMLRG